MHTGRYIAFLALVAPCAAPACAGATPQSAQATIAMNIARMEMPVVPDQIVIIGPCPGLAPIDETGCTWSTPDAPIYISRANDRWTLSHEMGHRYSAEVLLQADRDRFASIMRYRGHPRIGDERVADAYATCAFGWMPLTRHRANQNFPTGNSYWPSQRQQRRVCTAFRRAGERPG